MADQTKTQRAREIEYSLLPLRASLDQLVKASDDEGFHVTRETTEALTAVLSKLHLLETDARAIEHKRVLGEVLKERARARQALGFEPRRRRR